MQPAHFPPQPRQSISLIGFMGCGKSAVGAEVARRSRIPLLDLDGAIEKEAGLDIPGIFSRLGEPFFRDLESRLLEKALASSEPLVIATGGGVVIRPPNREILRRGSLCFFLDLPCPILLERIRRDPSTRPLASLATDAELERLFSVRLPLYRETAHHIVDANHQPEELARSIWALVAHSHPDQPDEA